jgi:hypothetical protein
MQASPVIDPVDSDLAEVAAPPLLSIAGVKVLAAWLISLALHACALGAMLLIVFPFASHDRSDELPVVHAQVVGDIDARGVNPSETADYSPPSRTTQLGEMGRFTPNPTAAVGPTGAPLGTTDPLAALRGGGTTKTPGMSVIGIGPGGGEGGGDAARYGLTVGGGAGPEFFGLGGSAPGVRSIVYVVDRSGSMIDTFNHVRAELKRSISALRRSQKFHVIFFNSGEPLENPPAKLVNAIEANKEQFFEFLAGVTPMGSTRPERALRRALALEPDLLYLLSDGITFDPDLPRKLDDWNRSRRTKIYTIAYLDEGGRRLLEAIARENGGEFKFVSDDDLP